MSTFNGIIKEFPDIRVDYFRSQQNVRPPAACFLSHVHSDHLQGLEYLKMPFVYCSAITKRLLLRLEKRPHRINFAKGLLEARKQHYKHLQFILRELPLEAPAEIELDLNRKIRVTLFDANHCPGAVMFLIEDAASAILYTGDIRAEYWWVNSLIQNPILLPYLCGLRSLDCVYLDTTFASRENIYDSFPGKAQGLAELLKKIDTDNTSAIYYFRAWTLGYEKVWMALANHLTSRVHVDDYQIELYASLRENPRGLISCISDGPVLTGFSLGNDEQCGILTCDRDVRVHSCEPGSPCHASLLENPDVIWITPIISRLGDGTEVRELGAGGGGDDLYRTPVLEFVDSSLLATLAKLAKEKSMKDDEVPILEELINTGLRSRAHTVSMADLELDEDDEIVLDKLIDAIRQKGQPKVNDAPSMHSRSAQTKFKQQTIQFPYSRHSSFSEQRHLIFVVKPKDICPCIVDLENWSEEVSIEALFGDLCSANIFYYDQVTREVAASQKHLSHTEGTHGSRKRKRGRYKADDSPQRSSADEEYRSAHTTLRFAESVYQPSVINDKDSTRPNANPMDHILDAEVIQYHVPTASPRVAASLRTSTSSQSTEHPSYFEEQSLMKSAGPLAESSMKLPLGDGSSSRENYRRRTDAFNAAAECLNSGSSTLWNDLGLRSIGQVTHTEEEIDL